jgi:hypothetical protein
MRLGAAFSRRDDGAAIARTQIDDGVTFAMSSILSTSA